MAQLSILVRQLHIRISKARILIYRILFVDYRWPYRTKSCESWVTREQVARCSSSLQTIISSSRQSSIRRRHFYSSFCQGTIWYVVFMLHAPSKIPSKRYFVLNCVFIFLNSRKSCFCILIVSLSFSTLPLQFSISISFFHHFKFPI